jgi:hypothetical protein
MFKARSALVANIRRIPDAKFSKFMDELADAKVGASVRADGRSYILVESGGKWFIEDADLPGSRISLSQLSDELSPPVTTKNGRVEVPKPVEVENTIRRQLSGGELSGSQLDAATKAATQQVLNNPSFSRLDRLSQSGSAAEAAANAGGRRLSRVDESKVVKSFTDGVRRTPTNARPLLDDLDAKVLDGGTENAVSVLAKRDVSSKSLTASETAQIFDDINKSLNAANANSRWGPEVKDFIKRYQAEIVAVGVTGMVMGILYGTGVLGSESSSSSSLSSSSSSIAGSQAAARAAAVAPNGNGSRDEMYYDTVRAVFVTGALRHQKDANGCWLYDKLRGTLTKVKLLSCGQVNLENGMDTCATQRYAPGLDAAIQPCPKTLFNPCLKSASRRTLNADTPSVPNVCDTYVYNGSTPPVGVSGVTALPACAGISADQTCSTYCKAENFNLPDYVELICINMDFPTAYADFMANLGYSPSELFSSVKATKPPTAPSRSKMLWVLGGVAILALSGAVVYAYMSRKRRVLVEV